jgi:50S ribosomal protein L16 3-hydroxylase
VLSAWLASVDREALLSARRERRAFASAGGARAASSLFDWPTLERVLSSTPAPDALVVRKNELLKDAPPRSAAAVRLLFAEGAGLVVRRAERHDASLRDLAHRYEREHGGVAHIQLFVTPAETHGFGWHYDNEDVFILQTEGAKTYYFRDNTQTESFDARPDFTKVRSETSPTQACTLEAGDGLFLPRGMWHVAKAVRDSLSVSLGLTAR